MRTLVKSIQYNTLPELLSAAQEISKEQYRFHELFKEIVFSCFGNEEHEGLIAEKTKNYFMKTPLNWAEQMDSLVSIFSPVGQIMNGCGQHGLIATADHNMPIDPRVLPISVLDEFSGSQDKQSSMLRSLKREFGDKYYINSWEWFWIHLAHSMVRQPEPKESRSPSEDQKQDELFYLLSRNPYLIIARKAMQHPQIRDSHLLDRMREVFEMFIIQELLFFIKGRNGRAEGRYQLKSQHLGMIFLLIHSRKGTWNTETIEIYEEYFLKATEYYSTITNHASKNNIKSIIRMWVYLLTREHSLDSSIIKQLQNANAKDGWYHLSRCPFDDWAKAIKKVSLPANQLQTIINVRKNIYRLLGKHNEWSPSFSFLATLDQYLEFEETIFHKYVRKHSKKEDDEIISRAFERILVHLVQHGTDPQILTHVQDRLNKRYKARLTKNLSVNFNQRSSYGKQILSRSNRDKAKSISYQNPRIRSVWQHPLQQNQFEILFDISFWISKKVDIVIPGHSRRAYPCLNIRILSNPYVFFLCIFLLFLTLRSLLF